MSPSMTWLLTSWGGLTVVLVILLIYRSTLTMHVDDQLFLNESEAHMAKDHMELMSKMNRITPVVKLLGAVSGLMFLAIAGLFVYQGLTQQALQ